jgi:hypothetical protein
VTLTFSIPSDALIVETIDAGAACSPSNATLWRCELGILASGATRTVRVRMHAAAPVTGDLIAAAVSADDGYMANNNAIVSLHIDHLVDVALAQASGGSGVEDVAFEGQVALRSNGRQAAAGATFDIDLHPAGTLRSASIHNGADCTLLSPQRARCALPVMPRGSQLLVDYSAEFADPGTYDVTFTVAAPGDSAPDNDTLNRVVLVRPYNDIAVTGDLAMNGLFGGQTREKTFTVTTDRRALDAARFLATHAAPGLTVSEIHASAGDCRVDASAGGICDFLALPEFSTLTVTVTYAVADGSWIAEPSVSVSTAGDVTTANDRLTARVETHGVTDLELRVGATLDGPKSKTLAFPLISVVNTVNTAFGARLDITLPAQVSLVSVSASNATCSGTSVLRCDFTELVAGATATVALSVRATADGTFTSALKLTAFNDNNTANDSRDVAVEISSSNAAAAGVSSGGGGGRIELWMIGLLALLLAGRMRRRARTGRAV